MPNAITHHQAFMAALSVASVVTSITSSPPIRSSVNDLYEYSTTGLLRRIAARLDFDKVRFGDRKVVRLTSLYRGAGIVGEVILTTGDSTASVVLTRFKEIAGKGSGIDVTSTGYVLTERRVSRIPASRFDGIWTRVQEMSRVPVPNSDVECPGGGSEPTGDGWSVCIKSAPVFGCLHGPYWLIETSHPGNVGVTALANECSERVRVFEIGRYLTAVLEDSVRR